MQTCVLEQKLVWNYENSKRLTATCSGVHVSKLTDFTLEMWTPRFLCIPAHRIHKNTPKFHDAQRGPEKIHLSEILLMLIRQVCYTFSISHILIFCDWWNNVSEGFFFVFFFKLLRLNRSFSTTNHISHSIPHKLCILTPSFPFFISLNGLMTLI